MRFKEEPILLAIGDALRLDDLRETGDWHLDLIDAEDPMILPHIFKLIASHR